jgi:hypothetical protein
MITFKRCIYVNYHVNRVPILVQFIEGEHRFSWSKVPNKEYPFGPGNEKHGQFYKNGYQRICFCAENVLINAAIDSEMWGKKMLHKFDHEFTTCIKLFMVK